ELGVLSGEANEGPEHLGNDATKIIGVVEKLDRRNLADGLGQETEQLVDGGLPQGRLGREVVVDLGLVGVDALGDGSSRGPVEPLRCKLDERGIDQLLPEVLAGSPGLSHCAYVIVR